jgi:hypothetical protein
MLLNRTWLRRAAVGWAAMAAQLWPALALAQAQVEAVPEPPPAFNMWNLDALDDPAVALPGEPVTPPPSVALPGEPVTPPASIDMSQQPNDLCRHFSPEERRLLPSLCGPPD